MRRNMLFIIAINHSMLKYRARAFNEFIRGSKLRKRMGGERVLLSELRKSPNTRPPSALARIRAGGRNIPNKIVINFVLPLA